VGARVLSQRVRRLGLEADHLCLPSAEVDINWSHTPALPVQLHGVHTDNFTSVIPRVTGGFKFPFCTVKFSRVGSDKQPNVQRIVVDGRCLIAVGIAGNGADKQTNCLLPLHTVCIAPCFTKQFLVFVLCVITLVCAILAYLFVIDSVLFTYRVITFFGSMQLPLLFVHLSY
jgi:hypothetical protein